MDFSKAFQKLFRPFSTSPSSEFSKHSFRKIISSSTEMEQNCEFIRSESPLSPTISRGRVLSRVLGLKLLMYMLYLLSLSLFFCIRCMQSGRLRFSCTVDALCIQIRNFSRFNKPVSVHESKDWMEMFFCAFSGDYCLADSSAVLVLRSALALRVERESVRMTNRADRDAFIRRRGKAHEFPRQERDGCLLSELLELRKRERECRQTRWGERAANVLFEKEKTKMNRDSDVCSYSNRANYDSSLSWDYESAAISSIHIVPSNFILSRDLCTYGDSFEVSLI